MHLSDLYKDIPVYAMNVLPNNIFRLKHFIHSIKEGWMVIVNQDHVNLLEKKS